MALDPANFKFYRCTTWTEGATHGGAIDTTATITDNTINNVFDNITNDERISGMTDYRKIFFRNENADTYTYPKLWISQNTTSTDDTVSICLAGSKSCASTTVALSGTATWTQGSTLVPVSNDLRTEVAVGEYIYNSTDDATTDARCVYSVVATQVTLTATYGGTSGSSKGVSVIGATYYNSFQSPTTKTASTVFAPASLAQNESFGIWIKRVVNSNGYGYNSNSFKIDIEDDSS